jgi:PAS domain S-box-containing protein
VAAMPNLRGETVAHFAELAPDAMLALDVQGRILWLNAQTERMFGYLRQELIGRPIEIVTPGPSLGCRKDGSRFAIESVLTPVEGREGPITLAVVHEEWWRPAFETSAIGIAMEDISGRFLATNAAYQQMLGYTEAELLNLSSHDITHEDDRGKNITRIEEGLEDHQHPYPLEKRYRRKDGSPIWVRINVSLIPGSDRVPQRFMAIVENITDRKRVEEALQLLHEVTTAASGAPTAEDAAAAYLEKICALRHWELGQVWFPDERGDALQCSPAVFVGPESAREFRAVSLATPMPKGRGLPGRVWAGRAPVWVEDVGKEWSIFRGPAARAAGLKAAFGFPVASGPEMLAVFEFFTAEIREPEPAFLEVVTRLGRHLADILVRKRAEAALKRGEERWHAVFEHSVIGIGVVDHDGRITPNGALIRMLGYTEDELNEIRLINLTHEDDRAETRRLVRQLMAGERRSFHLEKRYRRRDGRIIWVDTTVSFIGETERMDAFFLWVLEDITEQKGAAEALRQSEEQHRLVVETATDAVVTIDESGRILYANSTTARLFGYPASELIGQPLTLLMPESMRRSHEAGFRRYLETGRRNLDWNGMELVGRKRTGEEFSIAVSFTEIVRSGQRVFTGFIRDISEQKQAEEMRAADARRSLVRADVSLALARSEALRDTLQACAESVVRHLEAAFARIWILNEESNVLELQASAGIYTHLDGPHSRVPVGQLKIGVIAKDRTPVLTNDVSRDPRISDKAWATSAGIVAFAGYPLIVRDHVVGVIGMFSYKSLTTHTLDALASVADSIAQGIDFRRAETALHKAQAQLAHVTRLTTMGEMAASIAHEVNQPLAGISANAGACLLWLDRPRPDLEMVKDAVQQIARDGERASDVISRIRGLVRKTDGERTLLDVNVVILQLLPAVRPEIRRHGVHVQTMLSENLPPVHGDRVQLQQVVLNLIMNGVEAMSDVGDGIRELSIGSQPTEIDGHLAVRVSVRDTGCGFAAAEVEQLFEAFYSTKRQGLGMGLSISRSIIEAHGGRLQAAPGANRGAAFEFTLPAADASGS